MLEDLTFCHDLGDIFGEREYIECEYIIDEGIIRAAMLDELYRKKREQHADKKKLRNISRALILQWILDYDKVHPILNTLIGKIRLFMEDEVDLPYEKIIKQTKESFTHVYLRGEEREEEKRRLFLEKIGKVEEYLHDYEKRRMEDF